MVRKRTDIGEHFTREVIQSIVFIFFSLGESVHLTNQIYCYYPLGYKECDSMGVMYRENDNRTLVLTLVRMIYCSIGGLTDSRHHRGCSTHTYKPYPSY